MKYSSHLRVIILCVTFSGERRQSFQLSLEGDLIRNLFMYDFYLNRRNSSKKTLISSSNYFLTFMSCINHITDVE